MICILLVFGDQKYRLYAKLKFKENKVVIHVLFFIILSLVLTSCSSVSHRSPNSSSRDVPLINLGNHESLQSSRCADFRRKLSRDIQQQVVRVPESTGLDAHKVDVFFYGKWNFPDKDLIVIVNGGPGFESWALYERLSSVLDSRQVNYVFFDQRGTGCSSSYPISNGESLNRWQNYGSLSLARDIEAIRQRIAPGKLIKVFGHSFGAKVALRYGIIYTSSTKAIYILGDSFARPDKLVATLNLRELLVRRKEFFESRLRTSDLESVLRSLERKFRDQPCVIDPYDLIKVCGYDLIRDLGHYYSASSADEIERLLRKLDSPSHDDVLAAFSALVNRYTSAKLNAGRQILFNLDYPIVFDGVHICVDASRNLEISSWALDSCALEKTLTPFFQNLQFSADWLTLASIGQAFTGSHPLQVRQFNSSLDLSTSLSTSPEARLPGWRTIVLEENDHYDFGGSNTFWSELLGK